MTIQLPVSVNNISGDPAATLQPLLETLRVEKGIDVKLEVYDWGNALQHLNQISVHGQGPVISHIGTTWMGSLVPQRSLRPFSGREIASFGGSEAFFPVAWQSSHYMGESETFSIPWLMDTYVIYYRRDALQRAGVDEASAFASLEQFPKTLQALRASGEPAPWVNHSGVKTLSLVHHLSNWVWGLGGDFVTPNGRQVAFNSPAARVGIRQYFELQRFITPEAQGLNDNQASERYFRGQAAVTLCAASGVRRLFEGSFPPEVVANTGVAVPPGVPFVGGSNWVIWSHIPRNLESAALEFIAHITSKEAQMRLFEDTGQLPARLKALLPIMDDAHYAPVLKTLLKGRPFPSTHLWGIVEERLTDALFRISETLQGNPDADLEAILDEHLSPLEKRLNLTLSS